MVEVAVDTLRRVQATRYVEPLREGGSLPGLVEADDLGTYVVKFRGAGQGVKALVAEVIVGELGRRLGVRVPEQVLVEMDPSIGRREPDPEVQELLLASPGANLGVDFLPRSLGYDGLAWRPDSDAAGRVLWLDALTVNVDRSWRNPNLLVWHEQLWAIDHGAALLFQHTWPGAETFALRPYPLTEHALAPFWRSVAAADAELAAQVTSDLLEEVVALVPRDWLAADARPTYVEYLLARTAASATWLPGVAA
ncbi:MAG TPA: HipA family kinase [Jiangellaceae bacterium]|nr:HipA family kinase [Jiangellaceae bacterium]